MLYCYVIYYTLLYVARKSTHECIVIRMLEFHDPRVIATGRHMRPDMLAD